MKKRLLLSICFLFFAQFNLIGQGKKYTRSEKLAIAASVDSLLYKLMDCAQITEPGKKGIDPKRLATLKNLYSPDAIIYDDIFPDIVYDSPTQVYQLKERERNDYLANLDKFPKGLYVSVKAINVSYDYDNGNIYVALCRIIRGDDDNGYSYSNKDSLLYSIGIEADNVVRITNVKKISRFYNFKVTNDKDMDGIKDDEDECKDAKGLKAYNGCPDADGDGVVDYLDLCPNEKGSPDNRGCIPNTFTYKFVFSAYTGYQFNKMNVSYPKFESINYNSLSEKGQNYAGINTYEEGVSKSKELIGGVCFGANIGIYYGNKKNPGNRNKGVSLGLYYNNFSVNYSLSSFVADYKDTQFDNNTTPTFAHRRDSLLNGSTERINYNMFEIPICFRWRTKFNSKWGGEFYAGPTFLYVKTTANNYNIKMHTSGFDDYTSGTLGYEASPNYPTAIGNASTNGASLFGATQAGLDEEYNNSGYFSGYYTISSDSKENEINLNPLYGYGLHTGIDLFYHISDNKAIKFGLQFNLANLDDKPFTKEKASYHPFDYEYGKNKKIIYDSFLNASENLTYYSFGLNVGVIIGLRSKIKTK